MSHILCYKYELHIVLQILLHIVLKIFDWSNMAPDTSGGEAQPNTQHTEPR